MSSPAKRNQKQQIYAMQRCQMIPVIILGIMAAVYEWLAGGAFIITKSLLAGAILYFFAQSVFTVMAFRTTGAKAGKQIMLNMYLGQMLKWLMTLVGFALIFIYLKPVIAPWVIIGYIIMLLCHGVSMRRLR